jgi:ribose 5-phosphate isomerase RpiB
MISAELAIRIVDIWLATPFEAGRHVARIRKLDAGLPG